MTSVQKILPPIVIDQLVRLNRRRHGFLGTYESWERALHDCDGYESDSLVSSYTQKYLDSKEGKNLDLEICHVGDREIRMLNAMQFGLQDAFKDGRKIKVLDFGGAYGNHYPFIKKFLGEKLGSYVICESEAVSNAFNKLETGDLAWISNLQEIEDDSFEIVITSCALPYVPNPRDFFQELSRISRWIVMDRMPVFSEKKSVIFKQNAVTSEKERVSYPAWFFSKDELFKWFDEFGLHSVIEWDVPEDRPFVLGKRLPYEGFLLNRS
jgi:putative methyltransferase (TIGR04325 family)